MKIIQIDPIIRSVLKEAQMKLGAMAKQLLTFLFQ